MTYFRKSAELTVYIKINTAVCSFKTKYAFKSVSLVIVGFVINPNRIFIWDKRWVIWNRVVNICVLRPVITMQLPVRRNRNFFSALKHLLCKLNFCKIIRQINKAGIITKTPAPVQKLESFRASAFFKSILPHRKRYKITMIRQRVHMKHIRIFMIEHLGLGGIGSGDLIDVHI